MSSRGWCGKSDPIDALAVARAALREPDLPSAYLDEAARELRRLVDHRRLHIACGDIPRSGSRTPANARLPVSPTTSRQNRASTEPGTGHAASTTALSPISPTGERSHVAQQLSDCIGTKRRPHVPGGVATASPGANLKLV